MGGDKTDKITIMVLKVDLQCSSCYKKVKKILYKFPQIRDQLYDEKANTVIITVVCCNPGKFRNKLCSKGCGVIKSIEIKEPLVAPTLQPPPPAPEPLMVMSIPIQEYPPPPPGYCCGQCYEGYTGGPCYYGYGRPVPPPRCYDNYGYIYGPGPYGYGRGCRVSRCDEYFNYVRWPNWAGVIIWAHQCTF